MDLFLSLMLEINGGLGCELVLLWIRIDYVFFVFLVDDILCDFNYVFSDDDFI